MALPATASTDPFGTAENYNGFIFENVLHNGGDCEGALAIGGNSMLSNFGAGTSLPSGGNPSGIGMVVKRNSSWTNGQVYHGNMHVGGTVSHTGVSIVNGFLYNPSTPINFSVEETYLKSLSAYWASLPATSGTTVALQPWGRLDLTGTNSTLNVFFISNTKWKSTGEINLVVPAGSSVIINVEGTSDSIPHNSPGYFGNMNFNGNNGASAWQTTVWNFYNMTSMSMSSFGWKGSILAPYANFTYTNGNLAGNLIAKSLTMTGLAGSAELHLYPFTGNVPVPVKQIPAYIISKSVKDVARQGPSGKATKAGDVISYKVNVSNVGNVNLTNITLNDSLINLTGPTGDIAPLNVLNPGEIWSYSGNYTVAQTDINSNGGGNGLIENTATVDCTQLDPKSQTAEVSVKATPAYIIDKEVTNVAGNGPAGNVTKAGVIISYKVNVSNVGNVDLTNVTLNDFLVNLTGPAGDNAPLQVLNPGEVWTYSGTYTTTQTDINSNGGGNGLIENTATVDCTQLEPKSHSAEVPVKKISAYAIDKTIIDVAGKGSAGIVTAAGNIIKYRINVSNTGNADLTNVIVADSLINLTGPVESKNADRILNSGENWTYTGNYTATQADLDNNGGGDGLIENTAKVSCDQLGPKSQIVEVPVKATPAYMISKTIKNVAGQGPSGKATKAGDVISYKVNVSNVGNVDLTNIMLNDSLVNLTGPAGDNAPLQVFNPGEIWAYTGTYTVTQTDINSNGGGNGLIENTATVDCDQLGPKSQTAEVPVKATPVYIIDKEVIDVAGQGSSGKVTKAGDVTSYHVNVSNVGNVDLTNITLTDSIITLTGPEGDNSPLNVLNPGETWKYSGTYTTTQTDINSNGGGNGLIENTATVDCTQLDPKSHSAEVPVKKISAYVIDKAVIDVAGKGSTGIATAAGNNISYRINVSNTGNADLTNITVTDSLINLTGPVESKNADRILNSGENWTYTGIYTVAQADLDDNGGGDGLIENTAKVTCDQLESKSQTVEVPVKAIPSYIIGKSVTDVAGQGPAGKATKAGDTISYQVRVRNVGNVDLTNVTLNESLITLAGPTGDNASPNILNPEETWTYNGSYTVTQTDINSNGGGNGLIENTATVDCDQLSPKSQTAEVPIKTMPAYTIDKSIKDIAGQGLTGKATKAGDIISYQVRVINTGNVDLTNVTLNDSLNTLASPTGDNAPLNILNTGETWTYNGSYTITQTDINSNGEGNGLIKNIATVDCDQLDSKTHSAEVSIQKISAYAIDKTVKDVAGKGSAGIVTKAGESINYRINVSNTGNADLTNVTVIDSLINLTGPIESKVTNGVLDAGENWTYTGNYTTTQADLDSNGGGNGLIENTATVNCDQLGSKSQYAEVSVKATPAYIIDKEVVDVAEKGPEGTATEADDVISYRVNVSNAGNTDLTNVSVTDSLINLTEPVESKISDEILGVGEYWTYTGNYSVTQADLDNNGTSGNGLIENTAIVDCDQLVPKSHTAEVSLNRTAACTIDKDVIDVAGKGPAGVATAAGDIIGYRVKVSNAGNTDIEDVHVTDPLINLTGPTQSKTDDEFLEVEEYWIYTGNYSVTQADINSNGGGDGLIENTATVDCNQLGQKSHTAEIPLNRAPVYTIDKVVADVAGKGPAGIPTVAGDNISYRINLSNTGNTDLTNVTAIDSLLNLTEPLESKSPDEVLEVGENWTYNVNYTVTQGDLDSHGGGNNLIENTATVYCDQLGPRSQTVEVSLLGSPAIIIEKEVTDVAGNGAAGAATKAGDIISYRINVSNAGDVQLHALNITDSLVNLTEPLESITANGIMEEGEVWTYIGNYTVTQEDLDSNGGGNGLIENNVSVKSEELPQKSHTAEAPIKTTPVYTIYKTVADVAGQGPNGKTSKVGDTISYLINVSNTGNVDLTNVTLNDSLINLTGPSGDIATLYVMNPEETWTYTGNYTITQNDINSNGGGDGLIENTATVDCDQLGPKSYTAEVPLIRTPAYAIDKMVTDVAGKGTAGIPTVAGDNISYRINVSNVGNTDLYNVSVTDSLLNLSEPLESKSTDGVLEIGENWTYNANYTVTQADLNSRGGGNELIENTATVDCDQLGPRSQTVDVSLLGSPAIIIEKEVTDVAGNGAAGAATKAGDVINYRINVSNAGNLQLHNVSVSDSLINLTEPMESITVNGLMEEGEVWTYIANYTVTQEDLDSIGGGNGLIENNVTVQAEELNPKSHTAEVPVKITPICIISKAVIDVAGQGPTGKVSKAGDIISYCINLSNAGNVDLTNVTLQDSIVNLSGPSGDITPLDVMNPEETWTYTGNYTVTQTDINGNGEGNGVIENTATVDCDQLGPKSYTAEVPLTRVPGYTIDKTIVNVTGKGAAGVPTAGNIISYQIKVINTGNTDLTNVNFTESMDNLSEPLESKTTDGILEVGENWTYDVDYTVTQSDLDSKGGGNELIENTATVDCDQLGPRSQTVDVSLLGSPALIIEKEVTDVAGKGPEGTVTKAGDIISYRIDVINVGNLQLHNVTVTDSLINLTQPIESTTTDGLMEEGEVWTYTGNYTVTQEDIESNGGGKGVIENNATVQAEELEPKSHTAEVPVEATPIYIISKAVVDVAGKGPTGKASKAGDIISYSIDVSNAGNVNLTNITLNDSLINLEGPAGDIISPDVLNPDETWTYTGNYTVTQNDINSNGEGNGLIENTVTVDCDQLEPKSYSAEVSLGIPVYTIEKTITDVAGKGPAGTVTAAGDIITYQVKVSNAGNTNLTNINVNDSLINLTGPAGDITSPGVLNPDETWTYTGNYTVTRTDINSNGTAENGFIRNTATVDCDELDPQNTAVQAPIERNPSYSIFKSAIGIDEKGDCIINEPRDVIRYRIVVENEGNADLTNITVDDPDVKISGPIGDDIDPDVLNPGEVWVYTGNYSVTRADMENESGNISNTATVSCDELPEKSSTVNIPIDKKVELSIYKSFIGIDESGNYMVDRPGDVIQYQVAVKNKGNIALTGVSVNDPMVTLTGPKGDYTDSGVLNSGELWVFTGNYTVTHEDINTNGNGTGVVSNTAAVSCNELPRGSSSIELPIIRIINTGIDSENNNISNTSYSTSLVADFSINVSSGIAPLTVKFIDKSTGSPNTWSWDFNNDGTTESSEVNPAYTYISPGTYTVKLTVSNAKGNISKIAQIKVLKPGPGSEESGVWKL